MVVVQKLDALIQNIQSTDHAALFYETQESKRNFLFKFIANGLLRNKGCMYICSEETPEQIRHGMVSYGINIEDEERAGKLIIFSCDEFYIEKGRAEPIKIISMWNDIYEQFEEKGWGMRVTGETSCFFKHNHVRELLRYEYALHRILTIPMDAICAFDLKTIVEMGYTDLIMPIIRAHGYAFFTGPSGIIRLEPENVEDTDVEKLLDIKI